MGARDLAQNGHCWNEDEWVVRPEMDLHPDAGQGKCFSLVSEIILWAVVEGINHMHVNAETAREKKWVKKHSNLSDLR